MDVRFGESTRYDGYVVHRDSVFVVTSADGTSQDVRLDDRTAGSLESVQLRHERLTGQARVLLNAGTADTRS